jgi:hypothetical protein
MAKASCRYITKVLRSPFSLITFWIVIGLTSCTGLQGKFQSNADIVESKTSTLLSTPTLTKVVRFAAFTTPSFAAGKVTQTPQPADLSTPFLASITPTPMNTSDLLFLAEDKLMRWDHATNYIAPLAENVISFTTSLDGRRVALLRSTRVAANGVALFNLDLLDLDTKQTSTLLKGIPRLHGVLISPNAKWIAFQEGESQPTLFVISVNQPEQQKRMGVCNKPDNNYCEMVSWSPGSDALLWEDQSGIWVSELNRSKPTLVTTPVYEVTDPKGQKSQVSVAYHGLHWSPIGRYVLSQIKTPADVSWFAVLDTRQSRWFEVPGTFQPTTPLSASANWMNDGNIMVVNIVNQSESPDALIDLWQVVSTRNELFALDKELQLANLRIPAISRSVLGDNKYAAGWPEQIGDQTIIFAITSNNSNPQIFLYSVDIEEEVPIFANQAQIKVSEVLWAPDGNGALLIGGTSKIVYVPFDGGQLIQLTDWLSKEAHSFTWTPPRPEL